MEYLRGLVREKYSNYLIMEIHGVGYRLLSQDKMIALGTTCTLFIHTDHKIEFNNKITCVRFAFIEKEDRDLFINLLQLKNIGCKSASNIIKHGYKTLYRLIAQKDAKELSKTVRISLATASNIILNLQPSPIYISQINEQEHVNWEQIKEYLQDIGYSPQQIQHSINSIRDTRSDVKDLDHLLNLCIRDIAKRK